MKLPPDHRVRGKRPQPEKVYVIRRIVPRAGWEFTPGLALVGITIKGPDGEERGWADGCFRLLSEVQAQRNAWMKSPTARELHAMLLKTKPADAQKLREEWLRLDWIGKVAFVIKAWTDCDTTDSIRRCVDALEKERKEGIK